MASFAHMKIPRNMTNDGGLIRCHSYTIAGEDKRKQGFISALYDSSPRCRNDTLKRSIFERSEDRANHKIEKTKTISPRLLLHSKSTKKRINHRRSNSDWSGSSEIPALNRTHIETSYNCDIQLNNLLLQTRDALSKRNITPARIDENGCSHLENNVENRSMRKTSSLYIPKSEKKDLRMLMFQQKSCPWRQSKNINQQYNYCHPLNTYSTRSINAVIKIQSLARVLLARVDVKKKIVSEVTAFMLIMEQGIWVIKYPFGSRAKPKKVLLKIKKINGKFHLIWGGKSSVHLKSVYGVVKGINTEAMRRGIRRSLDGCADREQNCFSFLTFDRTIDFEVNNSWLVLIIVRAVRLFIAAHYNRIGNTGTEAYQYYSPLQLVPSSERFSRNSSMTWTIGDAESSKLPQAQPLDSELLRNVECIAFSPHSESTCSFTDNDIVLNLNELGKSKTNSTSSVNMGSGSMPNSPDQVPRMNFPPLHPKKMPKKKLNHIKAQFETDPKNSKFSSVLSNYFMMRENDVRENDLNESLRTLRSMMKHQEQSDAVSTVNNKPKSILKDVTRLNTIEANCKVNDPSNENPVTNHHQLTSSLEKSVLLTSSILDSNNNNNKIKSEDDQGAKTRRDKSVFNRMSPRLSSPRGINSLFKLNPSETSCI